MEPEHQPTAGTAYLAAIFDLSRGKQAILSVSQPALGAILATGSIPDLYILILGLIAATTGYFAVFSLNDVLDYNVDKAALYAGKGKGELYDIDATFLRHPLASGNISFRAGVVWVSALSLISAFTAYLLNPLCLLLFAGCVVLEVIYCTLRSISWTKTVISGVMVGLGGLAGWVAVSPLSPLSLYYFLFLAFWEIAGRNLPNDLADIASDSKVGIKTVATVFGSKVSALATLFGALTTISIMLFLPIPPLPKAVALIIGILVMGLPAFHLARSPSSAQAALYFNKASLLPACALLVIVVFIALAVLP